MKSRTVGLILVVLCLSAVAVGVLAVKYAIDEKATNRQHCLDLGAKPVHTSGSNYLCIAPDGRVAA